tara:strand:- start:6415 stop:7611 length:1197 start_codon:yes stop_codon:yes gene_type:complete
MNDIFYVDGNFSVSYKDLLKIDPQKNLTQVIKPTKTIDIFKKIIISLIYDTKIILADTDDVADESLNEKQSSKRKTRKIYSFESMEKLTNHCLSVKEWSVTLYTSGTTGIPKKVTHNFVKFKSSLRISSSHQNDIWGYCYNPSHIAGLQVFFQAFFNQNKIVDVFQKKPKQITTDLKTNKVTHISATPTFFRMLEENTMHHVIKVTSGGEKLDNFTVKKIRNSFPNAKLLNIYASTELGTLLLSENDIFKVPKKLQKNVIIKNQELYVDKVILGHTNHNNKSKWYRTGDLVEKIDSNPLKFKFISRRNEMINVGGMKVNPTEIEGVALENKNINSIKVYGKKNKLIGNILCADIVCQKETNIVEIKLFLRKKLENYKIPRIINIVSKIETTKTGKIRR